MKVLKKATVAFAAVITMVFAPLANAVTFDVTNVRFTSNTSGYGIDADEKKETLLDVRFTTNPTFSPQSFSLNSVGEFLTFNFGIVNFQEPNGNNGITANEIDNLDVQASFTFTNPTGFSKSISATATATAGSVSDAFVDYTLVWSPLEVAFGDGGLFEISMNNLSFSEAGSQTQTATITLKGLPILPPAPPAAVPEPTTVALLGLGLLGFATSRRKVAQK